MVQFRCDNRVRLEGDHRKDYDRVRVGNGEDYEIWWFGVVEEYSSRELSYPKDRLGGLAGVAKFISDYLIENGSTAEYLAGLWLNDRLEHQLRWEYIEPKLSFTAMLEYLQDERKFIAPSWSWASRNAGVHFPGNGSNSDSFQVIEYDL
ncbi:hypothetical protein SS1G_03407 [Sclerotinia sclerotiorum 1980 UF-70]|uniref:Heterokaryon incompatibility domain-containing protein n=2 Tax=Sclerotinia sclerotiorum (strain ATCC 18683 / 1980 / Ss-1) TaxID=665079 RepID=A7EDL7_SCLS1|nr:hypothetical protein SS1G_03407 [Sclerotinia sclerotiorum 1980 UF-70]APA10909.1 hypothetical protein sscle_07g056790 [Sclerotinia sclerotiorum 1980 UF-70]EDO00933.1 hypothetical protein SS1G_03407 [Sclerotinia sclerotiorum 1980 UF-70]